jgi:hypothetical protein|tara:strand:- start:2239 stop:2427 length:189 start_codon:yes stop_codon:yes gene_type:complete
MKLSDQAVGALLMTLQKCLAEEIDITDLLKSWDIEIINDEVHVINVPVVKAKENTFFDVDGA